MDEGFSTYAEHLCGYDQRVNSWLRSFADDPDLDLTRWEGYRANYGASYSFMTYLAEREGPVFIRTLVRQAPDSIEGIAATLAVIGPARRSRRSSTTGC